VCVLACACGLGVLFMLFALMMPEMMGQDRYSGSQVHVKHRKITCTLRCAACLIALLLLHYYPAPLSPHAHAVHISTGVKRYSHVLPQLELEKTIHTMIVEKTGGGSHLCSGDGLAP